MIILTKLESMVLSRQSCALSAVPCHFSAEIWVSSSVSRHREALVETSLGASRIQDADLKLAPGRGPRGEARQVISMSRSVDHQGSMYGYVQTLCLYLYVLYMQTFLSLTALLGVDRTRARSGVSPKRGKPCTGPAVEQIHDVSWKYHRMS
ncbi:uncharacterized protein F5Z01DRAFT_28738 [Emericellopsis atlantica]|uniref:Uncharacterized protein n=1 Tax=Emericellopsis atlantica TaxID=2614577 RepID=A0A9P7ZX57_9HYPO|nr:uncharacterized protein F5Z01DRAFT_28738 [Emericellopsis atlantica]KAG9259176.1 hypothetical protein F5Z01DRAFT_28738 [Emericellopsis atlantica]